jgi:hypothetical protein
MINYCEKKIYENIIIISYMLKSIKELDNVMCILKNNENYLNNIQTHGQFIKTPKLEFKNKFNINSKLTNLKNKLRFNNFINKNLYNHFNM